jgi:2-dehydro-3-deoxyphosphogluconate aldolase/(4S)-4-hydroxy-2-oxoglutarate aldolase
VAADTERRPLPLPSRAVVAVLRAPTAKHFRTACEVLRHEGITCFEFTLTTEGALEALAETRAAIPDAVVGLGTVRTAQHLEAAADVGAAFAVSQVFFPELVAAADTHRIPYVPGTLTPTEVVSAWNTGVPAVKVSPIGPVGGVTYLTELLTPLPDVAIMPTGGVTLEAARDYLDAGAVAVGVSGALFEDVLLGGDLGALKHRAQQLVSSVKMKDVS